MSVEQSTLHPLLLDARYWRERLSGLSKVSRQLLVFPRHDLSWAGAEASELWLRAHDGLRLRAFMARSLFPAPHPRLWIALCDWDLDPSQPDRAAETSNLPARGNPDLFDWERVRDGEVQLYFKQPPSRKLEDRVLDLVRVAEAARDLAQLATGRTQISGDAPGTERDEFRIARQLFDEGWV